MAIGFIRNDEEFTPTKPTRFEEELDLEQMWDEAREPSSLETRLAEDEVRRRRFW
ncbi:MAG: hypothetical protein ACTHZ9_03385 [Leucobacter sp.]